MSEQTALLIHSDEIGWNAVRAALVKLDGVRPIGEAMCADKALQLSAYHQPTVVLASTVLDGVSSYPVLHELRRANPLLTLGVFTEDAHPYEIQRFSSLYLDGFFLWGQFHTSEIMHHCLAVVMAQDLVVGSRTIAGTYFFLQRGLAGPVRITVHEHAALKRLAAGQTRKQIAYEMKVSTSTIDRTIARLERKLAATNSATLIVQATLHGLVP